MSTSCKIHEIGSPCFQEVESFAFCLCMSPVILYFFAFQTHSKTLVWASLFILVEIPGNAMPLHYAWDTNTLQLHSGATLTHQIFWWCLWVHYVNAEHSTSLTLQVFKQFHGFITFSTKKVNKTTIKAEPLVWSGTVSDCIITMRNPGTTTFKLCQGTGVSAYFC